MASRERGPQGPGEKRGELGAEAAAPRKTTEEVERLRGGAKSTAEAGRPLLEINVENLSEEEAAAVIAKAEIIGPPFQGEQLTIEKMRANGVVPEHKMKVGGVTVYWPRNSWRTPSQRATIMAFVEKDGRILAQPLYRSKSQGNWRAFVGYAWMDGFWYSKGHRGRSEESTSLPVEMQKALAETPAPRTVSEDQTRLFLAGATGNHLDQASPYFREVAEQPRKLEGELYGAKLERRPSPERMLLTPSQWPNFTSRLTGWKTDSSIYGEIRNEAFASVDGKLIYTFCRDSEGRAWIGSVEFSERRLGSTGLNKEWVSGGALTTPAIEHFEQTGAHGGAPEAKSGHYFDMYAKFLSHVPVIRYYQKLSGIDPDEVRARFTARAKSHEKKLAEQEQLLADDLDVSIDVVEDEITKRERNFLPLEAADAVKAIAQAQTFEELYAALERVKTMRGSKYVFEAGELRQTIELVRARVLDLGGITRTHGLREKVGELMERERGK